MQKITAEQLKEVQRLIQDAKPPSYKLTVDLNILNAYVAYRCGLMTEALNVTLALIETGGQYPITPSGQDIRKIIKAALGKE